MSCDLVLLSSSSSGSSRLTLLFPLTLSWSLVLKENIFEILLLGETLPVLSRMQCWRQLGEGEQVSEQNGQFSQLTSLSVDPSSSVRVRSTIISDITAAVSKFIPLKK